MKKRIIINYNKFEPDAFTKTYQELRRKIAQKAVITTL